MPQSGPLRHLLAQGDRLVYDLCEVLKKYYRLKGYPEEEATAMSRRVWQHYVSQLAPDDLFLPESAFDLHDRKKPA
jgi:hypothetical protein